MDEEPRKKNSQRGEREREKKKKPHTKLKTNLYVFVIMMIDMSLKRRSTNSLKMNYTNMVYKVSLPTNYYYYFKQVDGEVH